MEYLLTAQQMKECDAHTIEEIGIPSMVLMERAAASVVEEMHNASFDLSKVLVLCGSGNNGGDGCAVARILKEENDRVPDENRTVVVAFVGRAESRTKEMAAQEKICEACGIPVDQDFMDGDFSTIVDAVLGIGISRNVEGKYADLIRWINGQKSAVVSVDIPSGISADDGRVLGIAVKADLTVTFGAEKIGQILYPGTSYCGELKCSASGITTDLPEMKGVFRYTKDDLKLIPKRKPYSNKGTYGKVLLIAGSEGMCGAAILSARAAFHTGCGMVRIFTSECNRTVIQTALPEAIVTCYDSSEPDVELLKSSINWADVIGIGPGIGTGNDAADLLTSVLELGGKAMVLDADALNLLASHPHLISSLPSSSILTPHLGEMARLTGVDKKEISSSLIQTAKDYASEYQVILALKDARTVVSDGTRVCINTSGNNGMSTAGSGDVLSGIICGLLAQGLSLFDAASLGVYLHGLAGDRAMEAYGEHGMVAGDIADQISYVLKDQEKMI